MVAPLRPGSCPCLGPTGAAKGSGASSEMLCTREGVLEGHRVAKRTHRLDSLVAGVRSTGPPGQPEPQDVVGTGDLAACRQTSHSTAQHQHTQEGLKAPLPGAIVGSIKEAQPQAIQIANTHSDVEFSVSDD
ncbi:MAG: hypothetical protein FRX49_13121 [Trebouxia sp. A1-2]|nr:MAG: hypothetical protein FRX49_13121 [Trebouxia sp. A1-2]